MDSEQLKQQLGVRAKDIIADGIGLHVGRGGKAKCPLHNDENPSMTWYEDGLMWRCHACQGQIDIYSYYTDFERLTFIQAKDKVAELVGYDPSMDMMSKANKTSYDIPKIETHELTEQAIKYMGKRKIEKSTLDFWRAKQRNWMSKEVFVFQYFDEKDKLRYVSYRETCKGGLKGGCEKNTEPILWGMWHVDRSKPLVITEGQPDAMCVWQSGYKNVVSVPNGSNNFKWIDSCWDWLQGVTEFVIFADNDGPGLKFADEVKRRLKNVKVITHNKYKDANEVLYYEGPEAVLGLINSAINEKPHGLVDLSEVDYKSATNEVEGIETGFYQYDSHVNDLKPQEITVIFGRNGEGKTTIISQMIAHNIEKNVPTFLYSGEMSEAKIQDWMYRQLVGGKKEYFNTIQGKYGVKQELKPEVIKAIKEWHKEKFYLYDRKDDEVANTIDHFFEIMRIAAKRFGVKLFIIDNLMSILEENADSLYSDQANFVQRCKNFAVNNFVHVILLAHPNKTKSELSTDKATSGNLEKNDISGSANIPNKADNIIAVERNWHDDRLFDCIATSLKDRETGQRLEMRFNFSKTSLRFYNEWTKEAVSYGWVKHVAKTVQFYNGASQTFNSGEFGKGAE